MDHKVLSTTGFGSYLFCFAVDFFVCLLVVFLFFFNQFLQVVALYLLRTTHWQITQLKTKIALPQTQMQSQDRQMLAHVAKTVRIWPSAPYFFQ